jgi:hypothetical protein
MWRGAFDVDALVKRAGVWFSRASWIVVSLFELDGSESALRARFAAMAM